MQESNDIILSITQLNREAKTLLEETFGTVQVIGEISNLARPSSGHLYFTLKDEQAQVRCALFRASRRSLDFDLENGQQILAKARVSLYEGRGDYQLIVSSCQLAGSGALQIAFEKLKNKLLAEGLFDDTQKRAIPSFPQHIGVITSGTGAALRDILKVLKRRCPYIPVTVYPCMVQGQQAADDICDAIARANQHAVCDVLIVARGGGSLEDLWSFNEEKVARAIFASDIPIVSGVGHETDITIADFVADRRAATPSAAAETVSPNQQELLQQLTRLKQQLARWMNTQLQHYQQQLHHLEKRLRHPREQLQEKAQRLDQLEQQLIHAQRTILLRLQSKLHQQQLRLQHCHPLRQLEQFKAALTLKHTQLHSAMRQRLQSKREQLSSLSHALDAISPLATLERGYSILTNTKKQVVHSVQQTKSLDILHARLVDGELKLQVLE